MVINIQKIYKGFFYLLLFLNLYIGSIELNIVVGSIILFVILFYRSNKVSTTLINVITPLSIILLVAMISGLFYETEVYNVVKDFGFLFKPILMIVVGFLLINKINDRQFLFKALIYTAVISAAIHILELIVYLSHKPFSVNRIRGALGRDNFIELFAFVLLLVKSTRVFYSDFILRRLTFFKFLLAFSFVFYFSRAMFISFFILIIALKGYAKLSSRGLVYLSVFTLVIAALFTSLQFADLKRGNPGIEGFLYKIKMAPQEIFSPDLNVNVKNHRSLWDHWRAYEALMAIEQISDTKYGAGWVFGKGLGAQVDLGFEAPLDGKKFQYIPIIHNGYVYVLFKSGIIGLLMYLAFLIYLYLQSYKYSNNSNLKIVNNFISGIAIFYLLTSLIITGIYNKVDIVVFVLGGLLSLQLVYSKQNQINEDRNIRQ